MKRTLLIAAALASSLALAGCGNDKTINGKNYKTYGVFNEDAQKDDGIKYEVSAGSVICAIIFVETVFVPVYVVGWDLFQPVKAKQ